MLLLLITLALSWAESPEPTTFDDLLRDSIEGATAADAEALRGELDEHAKALVRAWSGTGPVEVSEARELLETRVRARLAARERSGLTTSVDEVRGIVLGFEAYKARTYVSSGVYPRRYFGYFDARGDTASEELRIVRAIRASTDACNAWLEREEIPWRVTDQEIAITWVAEGGAWMLASPAAAKRPVHPIMDIGLDDIAHGFKELPGLVGEIDAAAGTEVENIPEWDGDRWGLTRHMTLEESVVGTAIMWVWEKRIADRKLRKDGRAPIHTYDAHDQFIMASLVYNSGLIHAPSRPAQVRRYSLAPHLSGLAARHNPTGRRAHLPVATAPDTLARLLIDKDYPYQGTSWIALYHIQQRYGGYDTMERFTQVFDDSGRLVMEPWEALDARLKAEAEAEAEALAAAEAAAESRPEASDSEGSALCAVVPVPVGVAGVVLAILGLRRRRSVGRD